MIARLVFTPFGCVGTLRAPLFKKRLHDSPGLASASCSPTPLGANAAWVDNSDTTITADGAGGGSQWEDLGRAGVVGLL